VDVRADLEAPVPPEVVFAEVDDLARYPGWLDIVARAAPAPPRSGDPGPAWLVDLRGRFGPLARSKRLRMARSERRPPSTVRFERVEHDGRAHSPWILTAEVVARPGGSRLDMRLHYGGGLLGPLVERLLRDEIERSKARLLAVVTAPSP
jgi:Polyketide cyclase / dehydrase and lipid transport